MQSSPVPGGSSKPFLLPKTDVACFSVVLVLAFVMLVVTAVLQTGVGISGSVIALLAAIGFLVCAVYKSRLSSTNRGIAALVLLIFVLIGFAMSAAGTAIAASSPSTPKPEPDEKPEVILKRKLLALAALPDAALPKGGRDILLAATSASQDEAPSPIGKAGIAFLVILAIVLFVVFIMCGAGNSAFLMVM